MTPFVCVQVRHWQAVAEDALRQLEAEACAAATLREGAERAHAHARQATAWVRHNNEVVQHDLALASGMCGPLALQVKRQ